MSVMNGSIIANGGSFGSTPSSPIADVVDGGQLGLGPLLANLDANTPPVFLPAQIVVTHVPTFFNYIPNGTAIFKSLFETHLVSLDGINPTYTMDVDGTPVGRDGQMQNVGTKQTRSQITPTATWPEKIGNVIWNMGRMWMNAIHDIDTQAASMAGLIPSTTALPPHVASMFAADLMVIQYDTTYRPENIIGAQFLTNFFPTEIGGPEYTMNVTESHRPDRTFTFTAIAQDNNNTVAVAKSLATLTNLHLINYQDALPIAQSIESQLSNEGMEYLVNTQLSQFQNLDGIVGQ